MKKPKKITPGYTCEWFFENEILQMFPLARQIIPEKILEFEQIIGVLEKKIGKLINYVNNATTDEFTRWLAKEIIAMQYIPTLTTYDRHLLRLNRQWSLLNPRKGKYKTNFIEKIEYAKAIPINEVVGRFIELKKVGNDHICVCPFHQDKNPSMRLYGNGNNFYCFGCHKWGSTIDFVMEIQGCSFAEAVKYLQN